MTFSEWFEGKGGSRGSIERLWDPIAYALGFIDCDNISARCMLTIFQVGGGVLLLAMCCCKKFSRSLICNPPFCLRRRDSSSFDFLVYSLLKSPFRVHRDARAARELSFDLRRVTCGGPASQTSTLIHAQLQATTSLNKNPRRSFYLYSPTCASAHKSMRACLSAFLTFGPPACFCLLPLVGFHCRFRSFSAGCLSSCSRFGPRRRCCECWRAPRTNLSTSPSSSTSGSGV